MCNYDTRRNPDMCDKNTFLEFFQINNVNLMHKLTEEFNFN